VDQRGAFHRAPLVLVHPLGEPGRDTLHIGHVVGLRREIPPRPAVDLAPDVALRPPERRF
jgi:hypothetical protein